MGNSGEIEIIIKSQYTYSMRITSVLIKSVLIEPFKKICFINSFEDRQFRLNAKVKTKKENKNKNTPSPFAELKFVVPFIAEN